MSKLHGLKVKHWRKFLIQVNEKGAHHDDYCSEIGLNGKCGGIECDKCPLMVCDGLNIKGVRNTYIEFITQEVQP